MIPWMTPLRHVINVMDEKRHAKMKKQISREFRINSVAHRCSSPLSLPRAAAFTVAVATATVVTVSVTVAVANAVIIINHLSHNPTPLPKHQIFSTNLQIKYIAQQRPNQFFSSGNLIGPN